MKSIRVILLGTAIATILQLSSVIAQERVPLPILTDSLKNELSAYFQAHRQTPEDYVISKFADHDIVILGEQHRARHDPLLVQRLIPLVHKAGVYNLGFEFARRIDQPLVDSLLNGREYDQQLANEILLRQFVHWCYQEYGDIFKAAWQVNQGLKKGEHRFRIIGLNDSPDWSLVKTDADQNKREVMLKVWHGEMEKDWADCLLRETVTKGEKALVYCGIHHAFSQYRQPKVEDGKFFGLVDDRLGRYLYNQLGKRVMTIFLHNFWNNVTGYDRPFVYPADGYIDAFMATVDSTKWRVGFDLKGTPFGKLPGKTSLYSNGYDTFDLATFCDGYIFQMPFSRFEPITCIPGFFNEKNIAYARAHALNPMFRDKTIEFFEQGCEAERRENSERWKPLSPPSMR